MVTFVITPGRWGHPSVGCAIPMLTVRTGIPGPAVRGSSRRNGPPSGPGSDPKGSVGNVGFAADDEEPDRHRSD
jgi:hypothetical protein